MTAGRKTRRHSILSSKQLPSAHTPSRSHAAGNSSLGSLGGRQWGNNLKITVTPSTLDPTRLSILVQLVSGGQTVTLKNFSNLSVSPTDPQYVVSVIDSDSNYISIRPSALRRPPRRRRCRA